MRVTTRSISRKSRALKKVAYLLDVFPQLTETFFLNEIAQLIDNDVEVVIFSRRKPEERKQQPKAKELAGRVLYLSEDSVPMLRKTWLHLYFLVISPVRYLKTLLFSYKRKADGTLWNFKQSVIYAREIKRVGAQHIHSHHATSTATKYAMLVSMLTGIPYTFTAHGWYDIFTSPPPDFDLRAEKAKVVITVSEFNKDYINRRFKVPLEKIRAIHCGVDLTFFNSDGNEGKDFILSVARLHPVKGLRYLVEACDILKERGLQFKCIIVGEGPERESLRALISELKLDGHVKLVGSKTCNELLNYYRHAKVFVLPSVYEAMGVATMEAMACKVPVVATKVWGVPELVEDGVNGFLVPPKDPQKLADAIEILLKDPELCRRFGEEGRRKVEREFNLEKQVKKLIELWES